jgi:hypothetical protein
MQKILTILTCVTNAGGIGPGHCALAVDDLVYSFENIGDWSSRGDSSAWITVDLEEFLKHNEFRPVIMQTLNTKVNSAKAERYLIASMNADDDYISSGVCSSQVSNAINSGMIRKFDPPGIDTPKSVYNLARKMGIVDSENAVWTGTASMPVNQWDSIKRILKHDYPHVKIDTDR